MIENITEERAARRFHQMRHLVRELAKFDGRITELKETLNTLKEARAGIVQTILAAAQDEGTLPLFEDLES
jgi:MoxR-like ATPase